VTPTYRYAARLHRVIDGDTYELVVDLGFTVRVIVPIRLRGWNCPERNTEAGQLALRYAEAVLSKAEIAIESFKGRQSFARWVADVYVDGRDVGDLLEGAGHASRAA
jgi:endonuclease YncB( thermonuclease family)